MRNPEMLLGETLHIVAGPEDEGMRLDKFLSVRVEELTRSAAERLAEQGQVSSGGKTLDKKYRLRAGDAIEVILPEPVGLDILPEAIPLDIRYEDADLLVVNKPKGMVVHPAPGHYSGTLVMFFENGKCAKVPMASFETKTRRKKLANAYNDGSPLVSMTLIDGDCEFMLSSDAGKVMIFNTVLILPKAARDTQGVQVMRLTRAKLRSAVKYKDGMIKDADSYRTKTVPVAGTLYDEDVDQLKFV